MKTIFYKHNCRRFLIIAMMAFLTSCGSGDQNELIPLTLNGWRDMSVGGPASSVKPLIGERTLKYVSDRCTNFQILDNTPRAFSVYTDKEVKTIMGMSILGAANVKTFNQLDLDDDIDSVRKALGTQHTFIANADYDGDGITRANIGDRVILWADNKNQGSADVAAIGMRFESSRNSSQIYSITLGYLYGNGDSRCDR